jgi:hypothetical protein
MHERRLQARLEFAQAHLNYTDILTIFRGNMNVARRHQRCQTHSEGQFVQK